MRTRKQPWPLRAIGLLSVVFLASACVSNSGSTGSSSGDTAQVQQQSAADVEEKFDIATMVPDGIRERGNLRVGIALSNPPSSFYDPLTGELAGFDIEIADALRKVMGLPEITYVPVAFSRVLQHLGADYDVGAAFTAVTNSRMEQANFVTYAETGSGYAVKPNNPHSFDPDSPCGTRIAVQASTIQADQIQQKSADCLRAGDDAIQITAHKNVEDLLRALGDDTGVAIYTDSLVLESAAASPGTRAVQIGTTVDVTPIGLTVSVDDPQLTVAVQAGIQYLMDEGIVAAIFANYGAPEAALTASQINSRPN